MSKLTNGGPHVNGVSATAGRTLPSGTPARNRGVLDVHFAKHHELAEHGVVRRERRSDPRLRRVGLSPEYFMVVGDRGTLLAEANFAVMYVPLATAQRSRRATGRSERPRHRAPARHGRRAGSAESSRDALGKRFPDGRHDTQRNGTATSPTACSTTTSRATSASTTSSRC